MYACTLLWWEDSKLLLMYHNLQSFSCLKQLAVTPKQNDHISFPLGLFSWIHAYINILNEVHMEISGSMKSCLV